MYRPGPGPGLQVSGPHPARPAKYYSGPARPGPWAAGRPGPRAEARPMQDTNVYDTAPIAVYVRHTIIENQAHYDIVNGSSSCVFDGWLVVYSCRPCVTLSSFALHCTCLTEWSGLYMSLTFWSSHGLSRSSSINIARLTNVLATVSCHEAFVMFAIRVYM